MKINKANSKFLCSILTLIVCFSYFLCGCDSLMNFTSDKIQIVTTTTVSCDIVKNIVGDNADFEMYTLMPSGIDPHSYTPSARDVLYMQNADIVVYCGLDLEGKMGEVFEYLNESQKISIALSDGIKKDLLIKSDSGTNIYDPHFWFDPTLYAMTATYFFEKLCEVYPAYRQEFSLNLSIYLDSIAVCNEYCTELISQIPIESRILITAHDAFSYFGQYYDMQVLSLAGLSTQDEASTLDVITLADTIVTYQIKAIFTESSVSSKSIQSLQEAVLMQGFSVDVGGSLYSDSLGIAELNTETYVETLKYNVETIINALI